MVRRSRESWASAALGRLVYRTGTVLPLEQKSTFILIAESPFGRVFQNSHQRPVAGYERELKPVAVVQLLPVFTGSAQTEIVFQNFGSVIVASSIDKHVP